MSQDDFDTVQITASSAAFSLYAEAEINAPASQVFETYIDTSTWPAWNSFSPHVNIIKHALDPQAQGQGPTITMNNSQLVAGSSGAQWQPVSSAFREGTLFHLDNDVQKPGMSSVGTYLCYEADIDERKVSWVYHHEMSPLSAMMLEIERITGVVDLGNGRGEIRIIERQKGVAAFKNKFRYAKSLQKGFDRQVQGLKKYVESNAGRQ